MMNHSRWIKLLLCCLFVLACAGAALWTTTGVAAQARSTPTRPLPPPSRTAPPGQRQTPTFTPPPRTPAPTSRPEERQDPVATPEAPEIMPISGAPLPAGELLLLCLSLSVLGIVGGSFALAYKRRVIDR